MIELAMPPVSVNLDVVRAEMPVLVDELRDYERNLVGVNLPTWFNGDRETLARVARAISDEQPRGKSKIQRWVGLNCRLDDYSDKVKPAVEALTSGLVIPNSLTIHPNNQLNPESIAEIIDLCKERNVEIIGYADTHRLPATHDRESAVATDEMLRAADCQELGIRYFLVGRSTVASVANYITQTRKDKDSPKIKLIAQKFDENLDDNGVISSVVGAFENGASSVHIGDAYLNRSNRPRFIGELIRAIAS